MIKTDDAQYLTTLSTEGVVSDGTEQQDDHICASHERKTVFDYNVDKFSEKHVTGVFAEKYAAQPPQGIQPIAQVTTNRLGTSDDGDPVYTTASAQMFFEPLPHDITEGKKVLLECQLFPKEMSNTASQQDIIGSLQLVTREELMQLQQESETAPPMNTALEHMDYLLDSVMRQNIERIHSCEGTEPTIVKFALERNFENGHAVNKSMSLMSVTTPAHTYTGPVKVLI